MIPEDLLLQKFEEGCIRIKHNKWSNHYQAECPFCHEGKSRGRARRFYFFPNGQNFYCHNCGWSGNGYVFLKELFSFDFSQLDTSSHDFARTARSILRDDEETNGGLDPSRLLELPAGSVNLSDRNSVQYYKDNFVVRKAIATIMSRRLNTAVNRPKSFYVSLDDRVHRNRLVIPFYDGLNIDYYQSRLLFDDPFSPKYLSKSGCEKSLFGAGKIQPYSKYVFLLEGPIDAMFVRDGVAACGTNLSKRQEEQLVAFESENLIYVYDNQARDETAREKTKAAIERGEKVFIYPKEFSAFKDINEICVDRGWDEFPQEKILQNTFEGFDAKVRLLGV